MFLLIHPPFAALERPNLGLSLLKSCLNRESIPARVYYADHKLASRFGINDYNATHFDAESMLGDWLFSGLFRSNGWNWSFLSWLEAKGYKKELIAALGQATRQMPDYLEQVTREILSMGPLVVGCSSTFQQNAASLAILRNLKGHNPKLVTVMGGANLEGEMGKPILSYPWVDYVVVGEAEECIARLYRLALEYGSRIPSPILPPAVASRLRPFQERGKIQQLDNLPWPDFSDYFESLRSRPELEAVQPVLPLEGSRGCWWGQVSHCTFCGLNGTGLDYRAKSPARLEDEILSLSRRYGVNRVDMVDNIIAPRHLKELVPQLALQPHGLRFFWEVKANLKPSHFGLLRKAGITWLQPGIESFSDHVLSLMRKGQRALQNLAVLKCARENGIRLSWNLLLRHPGESPQDLREQQELVPRLQHFQPPSGCCETRPDRFSPLFAEYPEIKPFEEYAYIYDFPPEVIRQLAYFFKFPEPASASPLLQSLKRRVEAWKAAWSVPALRTLHLVENRVVDGRRPGEPRIVELTSEEGEFLRNCAQPTARSLLPPLESLPRLRDLGLCYADERQALSLVLHQPACELPPLDLGG